MNFTFNEPVLVRNHKDEKWNLNYFERYVENDYYPFKMNDETFYRQCIPYVGNEDLCYTLRWNLKHSAYLRRSPIIVRNDMRPTLPFIFAIT